MAASHVSGPVTSEGGFIVPSGGALELQAGATMSVASTIASAYVQAKEVTFTEAGAGTYTGTIAIPAGATILDIIVHATALWAAATSASLEVGDAGDPDGYYTAVDLKATDLLAAESLSFAKAGGQEGAYITATHVLNRYRAAAADIVATVVSVGAGTTGRTRVIVVFALPASVTAATQA